MKHIIRGSLGAFALLAVPFVASAQATADSILTTVGNLIDTATPIVVALALLYFFWGLANFILSSGDKDKREKSRGIMIWGVIALFIIVSIWGLIRVVQQTLNLETGTTIDVPKVEIR